MTLNLKQGKSETLINKKLKDELLKTKNQIDQYYNVKMNVGSYFKSKWEVYRSLLNKYETITKHKGKLNRAYFKLKEIIIDDLDKLPKINSIATLAEGPGGFIQYLSEYYPNANIYGITLKYENEEAAKSRHFKQFDQKNINILYGEEGNPAHDGNLYNKDIINAFASRVGKVDLVTADGGFEARDENNKEVEHVKLFLAETLTAFKILNKGGSFVLKIYDIFTKPTLELLFLLSLSFKSVEIKKPVSSRPANSERYVVCHGFKSKPINDHVNISDEEYESIISMSVAQKKKFEKFVYNLEKKNEKYVKQVIDNISQVLNFISVNQNNKMEILNKEKEQDIFKKVWEKVYEKFERKDLKKRLKKAKKQVKEDKKKFKKMMEDKINEKK